MAIETEIKLRLSDPIAVLGKLAALGYQAGPQVLEIDQIYDFPNQELKSRRKLLRLRQRGDRWTLTYKGPPTAGVHKSREEVETDIADGAAFAHILVSLGYVPTFRYEKRRTTFRLDTTPGIVTVDETPIGTFLELEGEGPWIDQTAAELGYSPKEYITASYASLYQNHRFHNPGVPEHMRF